MNLSPDLAGKLSIRVSHDGNRITQLRLSSSRPRHITRLLADKPLEQALALVPLLYSVCGAAQTVAALQAAESALGLKVCREAEQARSILVSAETARELGLRLSQQWLHTPALGVPKLMRWYAGAREQLSWSLTLNPTRSANRCHVQAMTIQRQALATELQTLLLPLLSGIPLDAEALLSQAGRYSPLGEVLTALNTELGDSVLGPGAPPLGGDFAWIAARLQGAEAEAFVSQPSADGRCFETGAWERNRHSELVNSAHALGSNTLAQRFLAIMAELFSVPQRIIQPIPAAKPFSGWTGLAAVEAARGLLIHRITLHGIEVSDYQILAPTAWNFHPQGTILQQLQGVEVARDKLRRLVETLVLAVDPCVAYDIEIDV